MNCGSLKLNTLVRKSGARLKNFLLNFALMVIPNYYNTGPLHGASISTSQSQPLQTPKTHNFLFYLNPTMLVRLLVAQPRGFRIIAIFCWLVGDALPIAFHRATLHLLFYNRSPLPDHRRDPTNPNLNLTVLPIRRLHLLFRAHLHSLWRPTLWMTICD